MTTVEKINSQIEQLPEPFQKDFGNGKLRPALLIAKLPGDYDDWLICMISSQLHKYIENVDEIIEPDSEDFLQSGLKIKSVIRTARVAIADENILFGTIGEISKERLNRIRENLANWIKPSGDAFDEEKFHKDE